MPHHFFFNLMWHLTENKDGGAADANRK